MISLEYAKKLAKRVLARNPKNAAESLQYLSEVLKEEGYVDPDDVIFMRLREEVARAAMAILEEERREAS